MPSLRSSALAVLATALVLAVSASGCAHRAPLDVETPAPVASEPAGPFPLDPAVVDGRLDNGLRYFVRENGKPANRAELRLVVDAGSILEDDDQRGLAHFVEHMAFNGTEHFEKQELVDYLEGIGMRFGPDLNAYTSTDETVYMLQVPTDDAEILGTAFRILRDWAGGIAFEDEEIDKERGVVVEEWRLGRGAWARVRDEQWPVIFEGSRYAERRTIGDKDILENAPHDAFRRFYRDWYRPDLMAIVAVGDFDADAIEAKIRETFRDLRNPEGERVRERFPVPDHEGTRISIATDPELTQTSVTVGWKRDVRTIDSLDAFREDLVDDLYFSMLNARLYELTQRGDPPFLYGFAGEGRWVRSKALYSMQASVRDGGLLRGLSALLTEARRVREHGFLESELARTRTDLLRSLERQIEERDKRESSMHAAQLVNHALQGDPLPGIERLAEIVRGILPTVTLEEVNARADRSITDDNRLILVSGPDSDDAGIPDEGAILAVFETADRAEVEPWVDRFKDEPLVADVPEPGTIVAEERIDDLGVTVWTLSNGATVVLKPTDFKNDEVLLRAWSPGGWSLASDEDHLSATFASSVLSETGLGAFDSIELDKALTGKVARVGGYLAETGEGLSGSASPKDLETMFELLYLRVTAPRRDEEAFGAYMKQLDTILQNQEASPNFWFNKKFSETMSQGHPRARYLTREMLEEIDMDRSIAVWRDRFADASDFRFFLVGSFETDTVRPLVERWVASLPAIDREESFRDLGIAPPDDVERFEVRRGIEPKASVRIVFTGRTEWTRMHRYAMQSMTQALSIRLREVLREDMGGVYGVGVNGSVERWPREEYSIYIGFGCDPGRVDELVDAVFAEIDAFRTDGPPQEVVDKVRESQVRKREVDLEQNGWWIGALQAQWIHGLDPLDILRFDDLVGRLDRDLVRDAAARWFDESRYVQGVLFPEAEPGASESASSGS